MALAAVRSGSTTRQTRERGAGGPTQQSLKSAQTRARLIDATVRCIVKVGYANMQVTSRSAAARLGMAA